MKNTEKELLNELQNIKKNDEYYKKFESRVFVLISVVIGIVGLLASAAGLFSIIQSTTFESRMNEINQKIEQIDKSIQMNYILSDISLAATPDDKIQNINRAIKLEPNNAKLYYYRAIASYTKNPTLNKTDYELNMIYDDCSNAIKYKSDYADAYYLKGQILFDNKQNYPEAYENFLKAYEYKKDLTVDVSKGQIYRYLGLSCFRNGDFPNAIKFLINVPDENKRIIDSPYVSYESTTDYALAKSYELTEKYVEALESYDKLIKITYDTTQKIEICKLSISICEKISHDAKKNEYVNMISQLEKGIYR